jgi:hypothetical protein
VGIITSVPEGTAVTAKYTGEPTVATFGEITTRKPVGIRVTGQPDKGIFNELNTGGVNGTKTAPGNLCLCVLFQRLLSI